MNLPEKEARQKICPVMSAGKPKTYCIASECMLWEFDERMFDGPDSYISEPGPVGHCGMAKQEYLE